MRYWRRKPPLRFCWNGRRTKGVNWPKTNYLAGQLAGDLGGLALALEQAGAYIATRRLTLAQYRQAWQSQHQQLLEWKDERLMQYPHSVGVTWQTTVEQLSAPARTLLDRLAWLGPEPVPGKSQWMGMPP